MIFPVGFDLTVHKFFCSNLLQIDNIDDQVFLKRIRLFRLLYSTICLFLDSFTWDFRNSTVVKHLKGEDNFEETGQNVHIMMIFTNFFTLFTTMLIYIRIEVYKRKYFEKSIYSICTIRVLTVATLTFCILIIFLLVVVKQASNIRTRLVHLLISFLIGNFIPFLMLSQNPHIVNFVERRIKSFNYVWNITIFFWSFTTL